MIATIKKYKLSDGSKVVDIHLRDNKNEIIFHAPSESHAELFINKLTVNMMAFTIDEITKIDS